MALCSLGFRELLDFGTVTEMEHQAGKVSGYLLEEHKDDGSHGEVTADSVTAPSVTTDMIIGPVDVLDTLTFDRLVVAKGAVLTPAQLTGNQNNWNPVDATFGARQLGDVTVVRIDLDAARTITGIQAPETRFAQETGTPEQVQSFLVLVNRSSFTLTLAHDSSSSSSANRLLCPGATDFALLRAGAVMVWYDSGSANWRVISTDIQATSGTFTPTLTSVANITNKTAYTCQYLRVGNTVTVSGKFDAEATAAASTVTQLGLSLPITSAIGAAEQVGGTATGRTSTVSEACAIEGDATNDRAQVSWLSGTTSDHSFHFSFTYRVL